MKSYYCATNLLDALLLHGGALYVSVSGGLQLGASDGPGSPDGSVRHDAEGQGQEGGR